MVASSQGFQQRMGLAGMRARLCGMWGSRIAGVRPLLACSLDREEGLYMVEVCSAVLYR
jgi:hypothetical protein